jgi:putative methanogenesis marker 16 metalloprotein
MPREQKTVAEINEKLRSGEAVVMTAMDFKREVRAGRRFTVDDVDVVTTGTRGVMSGTSAMLALPLDVKTADIRRLVMNGVPCIPVSRPEDGEGLVDAVLYGTAESLDYFGRYGGGHVLRELVEGKEVEVECLLHGGGSRLTKVSLGQMPFARLYNFRNDFQNYTAFGNFKNMPSYLKRPTSIFSCRPLPQFRGMGAIGSGELNPLQNDPKRITVREGTGIIVNGVPGVVVSYGTRSAPAKPCLFVASDMHGMQPEFMGGFKTSFGVEVITSIGIPFAITSQDVLDGLAGCLDDSVPMPVADIGDRVPLFYSNYGEIWNGARLRVEFDPERCICCSFQCAAEYYCPMGAISWKDKTLDQDLCFACGACTGNCPGGAFKGMDDVPRGRIGQVRVAGHDVPVIFRQSNRYRSELMATYLRDIILKGGFLLTDSQTLLKHRD